MRADLQDLNRFIKRILIFVKRNELRLVHGLKHDIRPCVGDIHLVRAVLVKTLIGVGARIGVVRLLNHTGEHSAFTDGKLAHLLAKVILGSGFEAVVGIAEVNIVHVRFQYQILGNGVLKLICQIRLLYLALVALNIGQHLVLYELLRYRRTAVSIGVPQGIYDC